MLALYSISFSNSGVSAPKWLRPEGSSRAQLTPQWPELAMNIIAAYCL